jgi:hypothetical protein
MDLKPVSAIRMLQLRDKKKSKFIYITQFSKNHLLNVSPEAYAAPSLKIHMKEGSHCTDMQTEKSCQFVIWKAGCLSHVKR